jgi:hypothetical protein
MRQIALAFVLALAFVEFTGPDNQSIDVNPLAVVSLRPVRAGEHFGRGIKCLIHTADGKFIAVMQDCDTVRAKLQEESPP